MRKQYKRVLASAMAAILIWNTCGWQVPALAASVVYQVEEIEPASGGSFISGSTVWNKV